MMIRTKSRRTVEPVVALDVLREISEQPPCRELSPPCIECCRDQVIVLNPRFDDLSKFTYELHHGQAVIPARKNGDCHYLDRTIGCTIHASRGGTQPHMCREAHCVRWKKQGFKLGPRFKKAAKRVEQHQARRRQTSP
jgi:hypothetical protein